MTQTSTDERTEQNFSVILGLLVLAIVGAEIAEEILRRTFYLRLAGKGDLGRFEALDAYGMLYCVRTGGMFAGAILADRDFFGPVRVLIAGTGLMLLGAVMQPFSPSLYPGTMMVFAGRGMITIALLLSAHRLTVDRARLRDGMFALLAAGIDTASAIADVVVTAAEGRVGALTVIGGGAAASVLLALSMARRGTTESLARRATPKASSWVRNASFLVAFATAMALLWTPHVMTLGTYSRVGAPIEWAPFDGVDFASWETGLSVVISWIVVAVWSQPTIDCRARERRGVSESGCFLMQSARRFSRCGHRRAHLERSQC